VKAARGGVAQPLRHVYVHYPFCARKCPYCDFNSHARREGEVDAYIDALLSEAEAWRGLVEADTIFVGGGTPTHATPEQLERYLVGVCDVLAPRAGAEITVEANPGSVDRAKVAAMRRAGVNRVSMGAQSFHAHHLEALGRIHDVDDTQRSAATVKAGGILRLSLDLILAVPEQTLQEQAQDVQRVLALEPEHVSAYVLTYEEGTVFTKRMRQGQLPAPKPERELAHLHLVCEQLERAGLVRYEISNFARPGAESRHNLAYWHNAEWLGIGAGAHSHVGGRRWKNVDDPAGYAQRILAGGEAHTWFEQVEPAWQVFESLMMGLRLVAGVNLRDLSARYGCDVTLEHAAALERHEAAGFLVRDGAQLRLTRKGLDVANAVLGDFVPDTPAPETIAVVNPSTS
jgi:oxygen-independent coproporphyrinogen-3 oxidase